MVSFSKLSYWLLLALTAVEGQNCPGGIRQRREWRTLSREEQTIYLNAARTLHAPGRWDSFTRAHLNNSNVIHGGSMFLPWHRAFIQAYENELRNIDNRVVLPYWNAYQDSQAPHLSPIFSNEAFGGNGSGGNGCVTTGAFANHQVNLPQRHCLQRSFNRGNAIGAWDPPEAIIRLIQNNANFASFSSTLEGAPHAAIHVNIGGDMSGMQSPNDPLFMLHHANVDRIWADWQLTYPDRALQYNGRQNGRNVSPNDTVPVYGMQVRQTLRTQEMCFIYVDPPVNTRPNGVPPASPNEPSQSSSTSSSEPTATSTSASPSPTHTPPPSSTTMPPSQPTTTPPQSEPTPTEPQPSPSPSPTPPPRFSWPFNFGSDIFNIFRRSLDEETRGPSPPPHSNSRLNRSSAGSSEIRPEHPGRGLGLAIARNVSNIRGFKFQPLSRDSVDPQIQQRCTSYNSERPVSGLLPSTDQENPCKLRKPEPLPDYWIQMNNLDSSEIRSYESNRDSFLSNLNLRNDYVSPASLAVFEEFFANAGLNLNL